MDNKAVIFDLDGTLLDTLADLTDAVNYILVQYGYAEKSMQEIRSYLGDGAAYLIRRALPQSVTEDLFRTILEEYKKYYQAHSKIKTKPYEGIIQSLEALGERGWHIGVVSNKPDAAVRELCRDYFGSLVGFALGDKADINRKPAADPVLYAMKQMQCDRAVFVGDSEVDVLTARNAGMPCISVTWGFRDKDFLAERGATCFADSAEQLVPLCEALIERDLR